MSRDGIVGEMNAEGWIIRGQGCVRTLTIERGARQLETMLFFRESRSANAYGK
jgi:hypothetical protein